MDWLPANQHDLERAEALRKRSSEELLPVVGQLIRWLRDGSWPVAGPVAACLREMGSLAVPAVARVLRGHDPLLKRNVIRDVVSAWPAQDVSTIHLWLGQLVSDSQSWGADLEALEVLLKHSLIDRASASQWISFKRARYGEFASHLDRLAAMLAKGG